MCEFECLEHLFLLNRRRVSPHVYDRIMLFATIDHRSHAESLIYEAEVEIEMI